MANITQFLASCVKAEGRVVLNVIILLLLLVHHGCQEVLRCSDRHHEERGEDGDDLGNRFLEIFQSAVIHLQSGRECVRPQEDDVELQRKLEQGLIGSFTSSDPDVHPNHPLTLA